MQPLPLPLVKPLKIKFNLNELQVLHYLQNYGYIINEQKEWITANSHCIENWVDVSTWWASFIAGCNKINIAYAQANSVKNNAGVNLTYSEAAALYKVIIRIPLDDEDTYAQVVYYTFVDKLNKYLC